MDASILKAFRMRNLSVRADAVKALHSVLRKETDPVKTLQLIIKEVQSYLERRGGALIVDVECITSIVAEMARDDEDIARESVQLYNAFKTPKVRYDATARVFVFEPDCSKRSVIGAAASKIDMYRERFQLLYQRLMRNPVFAPQVMGTWKQSRVTITPIESVTSTDSGDGLLCLLGMLTQPESGKFCLEDLRDKVSLDISSAVTMPGLFTETCVVLVQGKYRSADDVFEVQMMGFPPAERRLDSLLAMGRVDTLGAFNTPDELKKVYEMQEKAVDSQVVILSDVHLDDAAVVEDLKKLFDGFESSAAPSLFVFIGNFSSKPFGQRDDDREVFVRNLDMLASLIASHPSLAMGSQFVFVPGPLDPGASSVLPRPPLPSSFTSGIKARLPNCVFASNPCRIRFYTQEIVIFRADTFSRVRRHCVVPPSTTETPIRQLVMTLLEQGHLCPLPLTVQPVYWDFDHALRLYPLPDVVILADDCDEYNWNYEDCAVFNPGSFPRDSGFIVYRPAVHKTEISRIR